MMAKMNFAAERILLMQTELEKPQLRRNLTQQRFYAHACELYRIRHLVAGESEAGLRPLPPPEDGCERRDHRRKRKDRRG